MANFLFKTEPSTYSFADLVRDKKTVWDGVANPVALKHLSTIQKGDSIAIYHTGDEKEVVGIATAESGPLPDPKSNNPKRLVVRVKAGPELVFPVPLSAIRDDALLKTTDLVRIPRLSIVPLTDAQFARLLERGGLKGLPTRAR
jgi:predicted RNA-binding protein with PUA-like domain